jgi:AcrR family transcriptional regulator
MARPRRTDRRDSRGDILRAGRLEFAARGYTGAGVDRIAKRARVNKAMVYYHFASKLGLYRAVLTEGFRQLTVNADAAVDPSAPAFDQLDAYLRALLGTVERHDYLVPILLREIAAGGGHLDTEAMRQMLGIFGVVRGILERGAGTGELRPMHPVLTHFLILGSAVLYTANEPIRLRIKQLRLPGGPRDVPVGPDPFIAYLNTVLRRTLGAAPEDSSHA